MNNLDLFIIDNFFGKNCIIKALYCSEKYLSTHTDIKSYLEHRYTDIPDNLFSYKEVIYRIKNNINVRPVCPICGNHLKFYNSTTGYQSGCSNSCRSKLPEVQEKIKQTCLLKYGVEHYNKTDEGKFRHKQTCLERYGIDSYTKTDSCKQQIKNTCLLKYGTESFVLTELFKDKSKQTCLLKYGTEYASQYTDIKIKKVLSIKETIKLRYGVEYFFQSEYFKELYRKTCLLKYGYENAYCNEAIRKKAYESMINNKSYGKSKEEDFIYEKLCNIFNKENVKRQYIDIRYPFRCDFYIISLDLFIEYQGGWFHGKHPFDETNIDDLSVVSNWKNKGTDYYLRAIDIWTFKDVIKRKIASDNNLNYIEFFNLKNFNNYIENDRFKFI